MIGSRRHLLKGGAAVMAGLVLPSCGDASGEGPVALTDLPYEVPLESEPHERTFMQWPASLEVYDRRSLRRVQSSIALIARTIARYEPVVMLADRRSAAEVEKLLGSDVEVWDIPTDDLWCRDSGPTFVRGADGKLAIAHLKFNGWGGKQDCPNDALIAPRIADRLGLRLIDSGLVGEQGGVEHDGAGTLLAHASCWDNPNRNRHSRDEIAALLMTALGGRTMIWAPGIQGADITDYHIDALARFVGPGKVVIQIGDIVDRHDPWSVAAHETLAVLEDAMDASGRKLEIIRLPEPVDIRSGKPDFVSSYVNYYVCNGAIIAAQFGDSQADGHAREVLQSLYPGRAVEMLDIDPIGESGGGIHCATQQQPKAGEAS